MLLFVTVVWMRFGVYDADFGFEKPKKVEIVSFVSPYVFSLTDIRNCDAVMEINVVKERDEMEAFVAMFPYFLYLFLWGKICDGSLKKPNVV